MRNEHGDIIWIAIIDDTFTTPLLSITVYHPVIIKHLSIQQSDQNNNIAAYISPCSASHATWRWRTVFWILSFKKFVCRLLQQNVLIVKIQYPLRPNPPEIEIFRGVKLYKFGFLDNTTKIERSYLEVWWFFKCFDSIWIPGIDSWRAATELRENNTYGQNSTCWMN